MSDKNTIQAEYDQIKASKIKIDMTRGKPSSEQLDLTNAMDGILKGNYKAKDGTDCRNYGGLDGLPEAKDLMAPLLGVSTSETVAFGNSSLTLMYAFLDMVLKSEGSSAKSFLAPSPGYDRHFWICESLGIKLIPIGYNAEGPDLNQIRQQLEKDPSILGIWCVPKHSNPTGHTYSAKVIQEFAALKKRDGSPFYIMWDNAYGIHDFEAGEPLSSLMEAAKANGTQENVVCFASTSKITFAGSGLAAMGLSEKNKARFLKYMGFQSIGPDKVNQLRHTRFFESYQKMLSHMRLHAKILKPKFEAVVETFRADLKGVASWTEPSGGYFISLYTPKGCAQETVRLAKEAGVILTPAGAAYPGGIDPDDSHIRIAPSFPTLSDVKTASKVIAVCVKLAALSSKTLKSQPALESRV